MYYFKNIFEETLKQGRGDTFSFSNSKFHDKLFGDKFKKKSDINDVTNTIYGETCSHSLEFATSLFGKMDSSSNYDANQFMNIIPDEIKRYDNNTTNLCKLFYRMYKARYQKQTEDFYQALQEAIKSMDKQFANEMEKDFIAPLRDKLFNPNVADCNEIHLSVCKSNKKGDKLVIIDDFLLNPYVVQTQHYWHKAISATKISAIKLDEKTTSYEEEEGGNLYNDKEGGNLNNDDESDLVTLDTEDDVVQHSKELYDIMPSRTLSSGNSTPSSNKNVVGKTLASNSYNSPEIVVKAPVNNVPVAQVDDVVCTADYDASFMHFICAEKRGGTRKRNLIFSSCAEKRGGTRKRNLIFSSCAEKRGGTRKRKTIFSSCAEKRGS